MDHTFCPGSKILRQPAPEFFTCPSCGGEVEIWTDELRRPCLACGTQVYRDAGMSCLDWCKHGKECVGDSVYDTYLQNKAVGVRRCLLETIRSRFGNDRKRADHAEKVLANAEKLLKSEPGEWHIVVPASILHDIGANADEQAPDSTAGKGQEVESSRVARDILLRLGLKMNDVNEICDIITHHRSPGHSDSINFRVLYDAAGLAKLAHASDRDVHEKPASAGDHVFLTETGRRLARELNTGTPVASR